MKFLTVACIVLIALIAVCFVFYTKTTGEIIKTQEREISKLKREKSYLERNRVKIENITVDKDPENVPSFEAW